MKKVFSTSSIPITQSFKAAQEWNRELFGKSDMRPLTQDRFDTRVESADVGSVKLHKLATSPVVNRVTSSQRNNHDCLSHVSLNILKAGCIYNEQNGNAGRAVPGDMFIVDNRFDRLCHFPSHSEFLTVVMPRDRLERLIGHQSCYAGLIIDRRRPGASLTRGFLGDLIRIHESLTVDMAQRTADIAIDLIAASVAEGMAMGVSHETSDAVILQRAKAYVTEKCVDPALDPLQLANAMGVSLRRLQRLFDVCGHHIADWIWECRLQAAAQQLTDSRQTRLLIGTIAWQCGFTSQAHFSKRFRDRFGSSPKDFRKMAFRKSELAAKCQLL